MLKKQIALTTALIILLSSPAVASIELNILCWQGYAPKEKTDKFEKYITNKYQIDIKVKVTDVLAPDEFSTEFTLKTLI